MTSHRTFLGRNLNSAGTLQWIPNRSCSIISDTSQATAILAKKSIKYGNPMQAAWGILMDYCRRSTIHGIRYIFERKRSWLERLIWICIFVGAISMCARLISKIWLKWEATPVIVSFNEKTTPIWEIPFPSVVLCPESRTVNATFNFTEAFYQVLDNPSPDKFDNLSTTDFECLQTLSQVCDVDLVKRLKFQKTMESIDVLEIMAGLAPTINYTMPFGRWKHRIFFPDGLFTTVFTDLGVCHQFNGMHESEVLRFPSQRNLTFEGEVFRTSTWSLDSGYWNKDLNNTYPDRIVSAGYRGGLFMAIQGYEQDIDYLCRESVTGFSILLVSPNEFPAANKQYIRVPFNKEILMSVKPNLVTTSSGLRKYSPERRQCFFDNERYLRYFKTYTQNNCMFECLTNYTFQKCGCVKFSMPRTQDMPVCQASDVLCFYKAEDDLLREQFKVGLGISKNRTYYCDCLPSCTTITYEVEISEANFNVSKVLQAYKEDYAEINPGLLMGRTSIFFKEQQILTIHRSELYGTTDFLASSGGLLGLFLGISALSVVELIYFCTVRLISNLKMRRRSQAPAANRKYNKN